MNIKELRIGNYLIDSRNNEIHVVSGNTIHSLEYSISDILKPILLTEKWMFDLGYIKIKGVHRTYSKTNYNDNSTIYNFSDYIHQTTGVNIKYVHQLQNIYFALTNDELIYNA